MNTAIVPITDIERMAAAVAKSGLFGVKQPEQAMALMLVAQAEGLHPAIAARDYHIINGRPALKADAMLARFQRAGGKVRWIEMTDKRVAAEFSHPQGGTVEIDWTPERAKTAGISNDMHRKYPRQMLRARVISEGIRTVFPGVVVDTYTPEEVEVMEPIKQPAMKDVTPEPTPDPDWLAPLLKAIAEAADIDALKAAYDAAIKASKKQGDAGTQVKIVAAKNVRKDHLAAAPQDVEPAQQEPADNEPVI